MAEYSIVCLVRRGHLEYLFDVDDKPHVEHLICLVENNRRNTPDGHRPPVEVVDYASGCPDYDIRALPQGLHLFYDRCASVDRQDRTLLVF